MPKSSENYLQNRELSWLRFNERILEEAETLSVPLLERLNFLSIFTSNLDEFFMVRVGSLYSLASVKQGGVDGKSGMTAPQQLRAIHEAVHRLMRRRDRVGEAVEAALREEGITRCRMEELSPQERRRVERYFRREVIPLLSPQVVDSRHPFPHLENKALCLAALIKTGEKHTSLGLALLPALPRVYFLPGPGVRYLLLEEIMLHYAENLFGEGEVLEKAVVSVTRSADLDADDELFEDGEDYRRQMRKMLKRRGRLSAVRLELQQSGVPALREALMKRLHLRKEQVYRSAIPLTLSYTGALAEAISLPQRRRLSYSPFVPQATVSAGSVLRLVSREDILLSYPYESMEPFLRLVKEAASDPAVLSIRITIYRLASRSRLAESLAAAAENGKEVLVLLELRARFDEAGNIGWAEYLEEAGCRVIYGPEDYKVHSKLCLITLKDHGGLRYITQIGTGNYNEKTAKLYTDLSLLTGDREIGRDAAAFFRRMAMGDVHGQYRALIAAPDGLRSHLLELIGEQVDRAKRGEDARILIKCNSITDNVLMEALSAASQAGVRIDLIVRGICCLLPGVPGRTDHIRVHSVVGRYLEHSRVYCFLGGAERVYLSSADWMTRNLSRRVEIACPVRSPRLRRRLIAMLEAMLADNVQGRELLPDGRYASIPRRKAEHPRSCQLAFQRRAEREAAQLAKRRLPISLKTPKWQRK